MKDIINKIKSEEGFRGRVYKCSEGHDTVGYGTKLPLTKEELQIIKDIREYDVLPQDGKKIYPSEAEALLRHRLYPMLERLNEHKWFRYTEDEVRVVLCDMAYQLGWNGLCKFKKMLKAIVNGDYDRAANELLDSKYANQTPNRAKRNAKLLRKCS